MKRQLCILTLLLVLLLTACAHDSPPDSDTPWPDAHDGTFISEYGVLTFNGDGESVTMELSEDFAAATGLPAGRCEGTYVFLFQHGSWRYDKAESFRLCAGEASYEFLNDITQTDGDTIAVLTPFAGENGWIMFEKEASR